MIFGTVYAYFDVYLSYLLRNFIEQTSEISIGVKFGHTSQILSEAMSAHIDIAFTHHPFNHLEYFCQLVEEDDIILITDARNQTYGSGISFKDIKDLPFLSSNFLYETTQSWLFPKSQQFQLELAIASKILSFLQNSKWYTLLPRKLVKEKLDSGELSEIPILDGMIPPVQYYMIFHKDNTQQMAVREWLSFFGKKNELINPYI